MDYSKVPRHRRTRLQHDLFYQKYNEEKKRARSSGVESFGGDSTGTGRSKVDGGGFEGSAVDAGACAGLDDSESSVAVVSGGKGVKRGSKVNAGGDGKADKGLETVDVRKFGERLKNHKNVVENSSDAKNVGQEVTDFGFVKADIKQNKDLTKDSTEFENVEVIFSNCSSLENGSGSGFSCGSGSGSKVGVGKGKNSDHTDNGVDLIDEGMKGKDDSSIYVLIDSDDSEKESEESESSSEEDNDDPNDKNYKMDDSSGSGSSSSGEYGDKKEEEEEEEEEEEVVVLDEEDDDDVCVVEIKSSNMKKEKEEKVSEGKSKHSSSYTFDDESLMANSADEDGGDEKNNVEGGLKRRRFGGLDILVGGHEKGKEFKGRLAQRLRSKSRSSKKKMNIGKFSDPIPVDMDEEKGDVKVKVEVEEVDSSSDEDVYDVAMDAKHGNKIFGRKGTKNKNGKKELNVCNILCDTILEGEEGVLENLFSSTEKAPDQETLPLKFRFEDEDPRPPEKPEWEKDVEALFAEMDMALRIDEIGLESSNDSSLAENDDANSPATGINQASCCHEGKHHLIIDEQIGLRCSFCSFVQLEAKYILPSFGKQPWGRRDKTYFEKRSVSILDGLNFQDTMGEENCGFNHSHGTVWDKVPGIKQKMYPHQREGFEFIWKNIAGDIRIKNLNPTIPDIGNGCIISHSPGTGKTGLTLVFLQTFVKVYPKSRPVVIAPKSMLLTWEDEFRKWDVDIPFHNLNDSELVAEQLEIAVDLKRMGHVENNINFNRLLKLHSWHKRESVLGISYRLFEKLVGGDGKKSEIEEKIKKILLEKPGILVLDEGHTPRNDDTCIWKALLRSQTRRRVILSGTPFQNNFAELYNTFCLVNPKFGERKRGRKKGLRGKWDSLTSTICKVHGKNNEEKLKELKEMIAPFVHVHKGNILQESLPGLRDCLVVLNPTELQRELLQLVETGTGKGMLIEQHHVSLISVHPSLLPKDSFKKKEFLPYIDRLEKLRNAPFAGVKSNFVIELVRLSDALKEKVLIFSLYIDPLTFMIDRLKSYFHWRENIEILYMDGKLDAKQRQKSIHSFNDPNSEAKVLLASTKACSEGINLVGASRVVLLDVVWNPSVERQAISRAYRLGQKKIVYIYHLITHGTMECLKYVKQTRKDRLSELVFSSKDDEANREIPSTVSEDRILEEMVQHEKLRHMFKNIFYEPKEADLVETFRFVD